MSIDSVNIFFLVQPINFNFNRADHALKTIVITADSRATNDTVQLYLVNGFNAGVDCRPVDW